MANPAAPGEHVLRDKIRSLEARIAKLERRLSRIPAATTPTVPDQPDEAAADGQSEGQP